MYSSQSTYHLVYYTESYITCKMISIYYPYLSERYDGFTPNSNKNVWKSNISTIRDPPTPRCSVFPFWLCEIVRSDIFEIPRSLHSLLSTSLFFFLHLRQGEGLLGQSTPHVHTSSCTYIFPYCIVYVSLYYHPTDFTTTRALRGNTTMYRRREHSIDREIALTRLVSLVCCVLDSYVLGGKPRHSFFPFSHYPLYQQQQQLLSVTTTGLPRFIIRYSSSIYESPNLRHHHQIHVVYIYV